MRVRDQRTHYYRVGATRQQRQESFGSEKMESWSILEDAPVFAVGLRDGRTDGHIKASAY